MSKLLLGSLRAFSLSAAVLCLHLTGCTNPQTDDGYSVTGRAPANNYNMGKYREVVEILDEGLARELFVSKVLIGRNENGLLKAGLILVNQSGRPLKIEAQTLYFTERGMPVYKGSEFSLPWLDLNIAGVGPTTYNSQAIHPASENFIIRLRYAKGQSPLRPGTKTTGPPVTAEPGEGPRKTRASSKR